MKLDHTRYVPIIRWKRGEQVALRELSVEDKSKIRPLIELLPNNFVKKKRPKNIVQQLLKSWGEKPFLLDLKYVQAILGSPAVDTIFTEARINDLTAIPVTSMDRDSVYQKLIKSAAEISKKEICVRCAPDEVLKKSFESTLENFISDLGSIPEKVHLMIDYGVRTDSQVSIRNVMSAVPNPEAWKSVVISSGAFPQDLSRLEKNKRHDLPRNDWLDWKKYVLSNPKRRPTYSDYTVQYGAHVPLDVPPNYSASIRYAHDEYWVVMRGESVFKDDGPGFGQWPAIALLLCEQDEFCGEAYSYGDRYIHEMGQQSENSGSAETWIRAGVNHHLVFATRQISNLFSPASVA